MANNQFKFDIGATVRQIEDLNKALQALSGVAQGIFSNLGQLSDTFGSKMSTLSQGKAAVSAGPESMITASGQKMAAEANQNHFQRSLRLVTSAGIEIPSSIPPAPQPFNAAHIAAPAQSPYSQFATGYGIKDVPRVIGAQADVGKLSSALDKSISQMSESNRGVAAVLEKLKTDLTRNNEQFTNAFKEFTAVSKLDTSDEKYQQKLADLTQAMRSLEDSIDGAAEAEKAAARMGGGGGGGAGGGDGGLGLGGIGKIQRGLNKFAAIAGMAGAATAAFQGADVSLQRAVYGKQLEREQVKGTISQDVYKTVLESHDMTRAENILKYRADILFPDKQFGFIGRRGTADTLSAAREMNEQKREIERSERNKAITGAALNTLIGVGEIASGAAIAVGSGGIGAALGGAMIFRGVQNLAGSAGSISDSYINNPYTAREGGLETGLTGTFGRLTQGGKYDRLARFARQAERAKDIRDTLSIFNAYRDEEAKQYAPVQAAMEDVLASKAAMREGAILVGRYAAGPDDYRRLRELRGVADERVRNLSEVSGSSISPAVLSLDTSKYASEKISAWREQRRIKEEADKYLGVAIKERDAVESLPWTRFGLSESEFLRNQNQLTNYTGAGKASAEDTQRILGIQYGGLGTVDQNLSNLGALNRISGGDNNLNRLEQILTVAVSQGFDKSRTSQMFVQTTAELAKTTGVVSAENIARSLGAMSRITGVVGKEDERSLALAAKGISDYSAYSGQSGGTVGALKLQASYASGVGIGGGANILRGMNADEAAAALKDLDFGGRNEKVKDLLVLAGGDKGRVREALRSQISGGSQLMFRAFFNSISQKGSLDTLVSAAKTASDKNDRKGFAKVIEDIRAVARETAGTMGISPEAAIRGAGFALEDAGALKSKESRKLFEEHLRGGESKAIDPAVVNLRKFMDKQVSDFTKATSGVSENLYKEYLKTGGVAFSIGGEGRFKGTAISEENISKYRAMAQRGGKEGEEGQAFLKEMGQTLGGMSRLDIIQGASMSAASLSGDQKVYVSNMAELAIIIRSLGNKQNLNFTGTP